MTHKQANQSDFYKPVNFQGGLQIFELKQLADMEDGYKRQCRDAISSYKAWRQHHRDETDVIELLYGNLEGVMLRRHAEDLVHVYWTVRQDFRRGFKEYLEKSCCYPLYTKPICKSV